MDGGFTRANKHINTMSSTSAATTASSALLHAQQLDGGCTEAIKEIPTACVVFLSFLATKRHELYIRSHHSVQCTPAHSNWMAAALEPRVQNQFHINHLHFTAAMLHILHTLLLPGLLQSF
eukprot:1146717-Pelagomonas_calceolata.AAC.12